VDALHSRLADTRAAATELGDRLEAEEAKVLPDPFCLNKECRNTYFLLVKKQSPSLKVGQASKACNESKVSSLTTVARSAAGAAVGRRQRRGCAPRFYRSRGR
jgi:hypothetical protein